MISPISFLFWNIRGAARADSQRYLHNLRTQNRIRLLALLEPMASPDTLSLLGRKLNYSNAQSFFDNKIWVFWHGDVSLVCHELSDQLVHMVVSWVGFSL